MFDQPPVYTVPWPPFLEYRTVGIRLVFPPWCLGTHKARDRCHCISPLFCPDHHVLVVRKPKAIHHVLRANVGICRESQIRSEKSNFGLYHPNNPLVWLFLKMILKNPQALCIWIILEKFENFENFENSQKNTIFILEISQNFERFQRNSSPVDFIFLTYLEDFKALRLCKIFKQNSFVNIIPGLPYYVHGVLNVKITPNFSRPKSILVCFKLKTRCTA